MTTYYDPPQDYQCQNCGESIPSPDARCWECGYSFCIPTYKPSYDPVNRPSHYGQGKIEAIDYIQDFLTREEFVGYLRGNIAKYMHEKGPLVSRKID